MPEKFWCGKQGSHCSTNSNSALPKVQFLCLLVVPIDSSTWNSLCLCFLILASLSSTKHMLHSEHFQRFNFLRLSAILHFIHKSRWSCLYFLSSSFNFLPQSGQWYTKGCFRWLMHCDFFMEITFFSTLPWKSRHQTPSGTTFVWLVHGWDFCWLLLRQFCIVLH